MATVVDELTVTLGLDASGFKTGQDQTRASLKATQDAATRTASQMQADGSKAAEFFSSIKVQALSLLGVFLGGKGIESFIRDTTKSVADLGRAALNAGQDVTGFAAFGEAVRRMGGDANAAEQSMVRLMHTLQLVRTGQAGPETAQFLSILGLGINATSEQAEAAMMRYVEAHVGTPQGRQLILQVGEGIGFDESTLNSLMQIRTVANFNQQLGLSRQLGVPTQQMVDDLTKLQTATITFEQAIEGFSRKILQDIAPGLTAFIDQLTKDVEYLDTLHPLQWLKDFLDQYFGSAPFGDAPGAGSGGALQPNPENYPTGPTEWLRQHFPFIYGDKSPPIADQTMPPAEQAFLNTLSAPESQGSYTARNASGHFGRYQFDEATWREVAGILHLPDQSPVSQDRAAWYLAAREYYQKTGRTLLGDIQEGGHEADIANALKGRWPSLPGGSQQLVTPHDFSTNLQRNLRAGPRSTLPAPPANNNSQSMNIGQVTVYSQATDAKGIARDIRVALAQEIAAQANRGLA